MRARGRRCRGGSPRRRIAAIRMPGRQLQSRLSALGFWLQDLIRGVRCQGVRVRGRTVAGLETALDRETVVARPFRNAIGFSAPARSSRLPRDVLRSGDVAGGRAACVLRGFRAGGMRESLHPRRFRPVEAGRRRGADAARRARSRSLRQVSLPFGAGVGLRTADGRLPADDRIALDRAAAGRDCARRASGNRTTSETPRLIE